MEKTNKKTRNISRIIRWIVLFLVVLFATSIGIIHQKVKSPVVQGVDALCPFGAIESVFSLIVTGLYLKRIAFTGIIIFIAVLIIAFVFRRAFCGQICALGGLQEFFAKIGQKIFKKRLNIPLSIDKPLRYLKYLILILILIWQSVTVYQMYKLGVKQADLVIRPYDPWAAFNHLTSSELFTDFLIGFILLIITFAGSFLFDRFFCKYLCPMGAFLGLINKIGLFKVVRNKETCIDCMACDKACPVNIKVQSLEIVNSSECINCNECVNACPVKDTLYEQGPIKKLKIHPILFTLITIGIFMSVIGITTATKQFSWYQKSLKEEVKQSNAFDAELIKGRMTFKEVSDASGIPKEVFINKLKITEEEFNLAIKDVMPKYGLETESVRTFIIEELKNK